MLIFSGSFQFQRMIPEGNSVEAHTEQILHLIWAGARTDTTLDLAESFFCDKTQS